jgi:hypothetical protein
MFKNVIAFCLLLDAASELLSFGFVCISGWLTSPHLLVSFRFWLTHVSLILVAAVQIEGFALSPS